MNAHLEPAESFSGLVQSALSDVDLGALARSTGAIVRERDLGSPDCLLRLAWLYGPGGYSLRMTAGLAAATGLADVSDVAVLKALVRSADWLEVLLNALLERRCGVAAGVDRPLHLIDATSISAPGPAGAEAWRLHCRYQPGVGFTGFELTDRHGGENLQRHALPAGALVLGDRAYARGGAGLAHVRACGADYLLRVGWRALAWRQSTGEAFDLFAHLDQLRPGEHADLNVWIGHGDALIPTRLLILAKDEARAQYAQRKARRKSQKDGTKLDQRTEIAARYLILVTSLEAESHPPDEILALYRLRWQIELAFKRLKSLLNIHRLPAKDANLARTWLYSHLLAALLVEQISQHMLDSPPSAPLENKKTQTIPMAPATPDPRRHARRSTRSHRKNQ